MMADKIRWGILSTANIGRKHVTPALQASKNGEVVAVASRNADAARDYADALGIPKSYGSYEDLLADPDVDAIYNPLPNHLHAEWSVKCAEAGKAILCEKPLASDATEAQKFVNQVAQHHVLIAEAFMYRHHPQTRRVRQMLADGAIGTLHMMSASFTFSLSNPANIRLQADMGGGGLMDVGCYCINVMRHMTGAEPDDVAALTNVGAETNVDEYFAGVLRFPSHVLGHFDSGLRTYRVHSYELRGSDGRILVPEGFTMPKDRPTTIHYWHGDNYEEITIPPANSYQIMGEDFADALINGREPRFAIQDGVQNMQVIDRLKDVAQTRMV